MLSLIVTQYPAVSERETSQVRGEKENLEKLIKIPVSIAQQVERHDVIPSILSLCTSSSTLDDFASSAKNVMESASIEESGRLSHWYT